MDRAQLTAAARTALLRGGLEGVSLRDLCAEGRRADHSRMLAEQAAAQGWLERGDVMRLLGVSRTAARQQLLRLREAGVLVRVGERYYPAGAVTPPEEQLAVIQTYLREHGSGRRQDFLRLLNVSPAQGTQILRRLTARGELILTGGTTRCQKGISRLRLPELLAAYFHIKTSLFYALVTFRQKVFTKWGESC